MSSNTLATRTTRFLAITLAVIAAVLWLIILVAPAHADATPRHAHKITHSFFTFRPCDKDDKCAARDQGARDGAGDYHHMVKIVPMYPTAFVGEVVAGAFPEGAQLECDVVDEVVGETVQVPGREGRQETATVHVMMLRCKGGAAARFVRVVFAGVE